MAHFRIDDTLGPLGRLFYDLSYYEPASWQWSFGDGTFSQDTSPIHQYAQAGVYDVCLIVANANGADTLCRTVYIGVTGTPAAAAKEVFAVNVFPNPASEQLRLETLAPLPDQTVILLFDLLGRRVMTIPAPVGARSLALSVGALPPGMYVLAGKTDGKVLFWKTVAVQQ